MTMQSQETAAQTAATEKPVQPTDKTLPQTEKNRRSLPHVTLWQDEAGIIQIKLGHGINPSNAIALLEMGILRYKMMLLPSVSPRPAQAPEGSEPPEMSAL